MSVNMEAARAQMLDQQIRAGDVLDEKVLETLGKIPRERFVPDAYREVAFADDLIPLGHQQTMMLPQLEGRALKACQLTSIDEVLEVGTGSGFLTACLADLGGHVRSIDIYEDFVSSAQARFKEQRISNIVAVAGNAMQESFEDKYDVIVLTASLPEFPNRFIDLLKPGGRLFAVVGREPIMEAQLITRKSDDSIDTEVLFETLLAPMVNNGSTPNFVL